MAISVCMATYNGELYLMEQIDSILRQLRPSDEIVVVDDCSTDNTVRMLRSLNDPRIRIFINSKNMSHVYSFNRAIALAQNDYIFMSDQDDVWVDGRLGLMLDSLRCSGRMVVSSNSFAIDKEGRLLDFCIDGVHACDSANHLKNIVDIYKGKVNYCGCTMAFHESLRRIILPIPSFVESHDLWISLASNLFRSNLHLDQRTLYRRIHGGNASIISRSLHQKLWSRFIFTLSILVLLVRKTCNRSS